MEKKLTAVEWLMEQVNSSEYQKAFGQTYVSIELVEQAKEMEKEQIEKAIDECRHNYKHSDNYYNETYGKETDRS